MFATNVAFGPHVADACVPMERLQVAEIMLDLTFCVAQREGMDTREASMLGIWMDGLAGGDGTT